MAVELVHPEVNLNVTRQVDGPLIRKLSVSNFRNYSKVSLEPSQQMVVLLGNNGAGKTNLLEAISMLSPGRGLRRAQLTQLNRAKIDTTDEDNIIEAQRQWAVSVKVVSNGFQTSIGTGCATAFADGKIAKRLVKINGDIVKSQISLNDYLTLSWLTPQMDRLFLEGSSQRRRFLDRLVFAFDALHSKRVNRYNHALRERKKLLLSWTQDAAWLNAIENSLAEMGVAIVVTRQDLIRRLSPIIGKNMGLFPSAIISMEGEVESWLEDGSALEAEQKFREELKKSRANGFSEYSQIPGPHRSEFNCVHSSNKMEASLCSTGEQKALLVSIVLSHAILRKKECGSAPILLLDEISAHLDERRRSSLFELLQNLESQIWMTGTESGAFSDILKIAETYNISEGKII
jgi:DNA replication and repair protein RecF